MRNLILGAAALAALVGTTSLARADYCDQAVDRAVTQTIDGTLNSKGADLLNAIRALEAAGQGGSPIHQKLVDAYNNARAQLQQQAAPIADQRVKECRSGFAPAQKFADFVVADLTGGLSLILPPDMTHIDMGQVLSGNRLGGENSFFHKNLGLPW